jgi:lysophospholipase L1-like esterase
MNRKTRLATLAILLPLAFTPLSAKADYALKDGDTVAFLGDSITAAMTYGKIVENYTLLRYPGRKVRFFNAGWGGDTAAGGLKRLDRDVLDRGATVVIVAYGINDIGWGTRADDEHRNLYLNSIRGIVDRCKERKARVFICSAAITAEDPSRSETGYLQKMCDEGMAIAREKGEASIDIQRSMRPILRKVLDAAKKEKNAKDKPTLHAADGIHLNDLGQLAMAFAIIKGLGAPAEVSSVELDARNPSAIVAQGCRITNVTGESNHLEFDRLDEGLPVNFGTFGALQFRFVPIPEEINRYMLTVEGLADGRYEVLADGRPLGTWPAEQLAKGINICSATADGWEPGGPWDAQASALIQLTNARSEVAGARRQLNHYLPHYPEADTVRSQTETAIARIEDLQRTLVKPRPFHFVVRPEKPKAKERP